MRSDDLYLADIVSAAQKITRYLKGRTEQDLQQDEMLFDAVVRAFQVLGEASMKLSQETRDLYPLPWSEIIAFRNVIVHDYAVLSSVLLWNTAMKDVPEILRLLADYIDTQMKKSLQDDTNRTH